MQGPDEWGSLCNTHLLAKRFEQLAGFILNEDASEIITKRFYFFFAVDSLVEINQNLVDVTYCVNRLMLRYSDVKEISCRLKCNNVVPLVAHKHFDFEIDLKILKIDLKLIS